MAPEVLEKEHYSNKIDVFSFGMFLYYILTNTEPWYEIENPTSEKIFNYIVQGKRPELQDKEIPDRFKDLIEECLSQEPKKRPSFIQIVDNLMNNKEDFYDLSLIDEEELDIYMLYAIEMLR